jgi:hypothetical protein
LVAQPLCAVQPGDSEMTAWLIWLTGLSLEKV